MKPAVRQILLSPQWTPMRLFAAGEQGGWWDPADFSTMFQDSAGTTPVTAVGQPVGLIRDKSGRGNHLLQGTTTQRPLLGQDAGGFYHLLFDGVDDGLATAGNVDFTGTSQMLVTAGLQKANDAAVGFVVYTSSNFATSPGAFAMRAPSTAATGNFGLNVSGATTNAQLATSSTYAAPISKVVSALMDLAGQTAALRVNGVQDGTSGLAVGAGPFGSYPLTIGKSGGGAAPFVGRMYQVLARGAASTAVQIAQAERFVGSRMGIPL